MLARLYDLTGATAMYHKALALALPQATASHPNEQALYSSADSYAELGEAEAILATVSGQSLRNQIAHGDQAYSWYESRMGVWNEIKEPGSLSPDGFDPIPRPGRHPATGAVQACAPPPRNVLPTSCAARSVSRIRPLTSAVPRRPDRCKKMVTRATPTPGTKRLFVHRGRFQTGAQSVPMDFKLLICPGFAVSQHS